jgi:hypothetical protein
VECFGVLTLPGDTPYHYKQINFQLMNQLTRSQIKQLIGGKTALPNYAIGSWQLTGWQLESGQCFCDYHVTFAGGGFGDWCHVECPTSNCSPLPLN